jgi:hypothetical protein
MAEEPIKRLLGLTGPAFTQLLRDEGGEGIRKRLAAINLPAEISRTRELVRTAPASRKDAAIKKLKVLVGLQKQQIKPEELVITKVPVLPPVYRPTSIVNGMELTNDANLLYKDLFEANKDYAQLRKQLGNAPEERLALYQSLAAVTGLGEPVNPKTQEKQAAGFLTHIFGKGSPKFGLFQRKLLATTVDSVGRAAVTPNQDLDIDQVGIPESMAWETYKPYILRRLTRAYNAGGRNVPMTELIKWIDNKDPKARKALEEEMKERPVIMSRAPVWHRFGVIAQKPVLVSGNTIQVSPLVTPGLGMDFDGDSCVGGTICTLTIAPKTAKLLHKEAFMPFTKNELLTISAGLPLVKDIRLEDFPYDKSAVEVRPSGVIVYAVPAGVCVLSYDQATGKSGFFPVTHFSIHPNCKGFAVLTQGGEKVGASADHSLFVYDNATGKTVETKPTDAVGRAVPVIKHALHRNVAGDRWPIPFTLTDTPSGRRAKQPSADVQLDFDFGWWLGACASDAWTTAGSNQLFYAKTERTLIDAFIAGCSRIVPGVVDGLTKSARHVDSEMGLDATSTCTVFSSSALVGVFNAWFYADPARHCARTKQVLPALASFPEECLWGLLSGLLDGDGTLSFNTSKKRSKVGVNISFTTTSRALAAQIHLLGRLLGVRVGESASHGDAVVLTFSTVDIYRNKEKIRLRAENKRAVLEAMEEPTRDIMDRVPVPAGVIQAAAVSLRRRSRDASSVYGAKNGGLISRQLARDVVAALREDGVKLAALDAWEQVVADTSVSWDIVKEIEEIPEQTMYDLTVPDTNVFAVNGGLVVWDTVNLHVPSTPGAVKQALEKMLPSVNLLNSSKFEVHMIPRQEFLIGLNRATRPAARKQPIRVASREEALALFRAGKIGLTDPIEIKEAKA